MIGNNSKYLKVVYSLCNYIIIYMNFKYVDHLQGNKAILSPKF